ncbi:hypothetical protein ACFPRL_06910 [Pseudoclavibacter helvolus]
MELLARLQLAVRGQRRQRRLDLAELGQDARGGGEPALAVREFPGRSLQFRHLGDERVDVGLQVGVGDALLQRREARADGRERRDGTRDIAGHLVAHALDARVDRVDLRLHVSTRATAISRCALRGRGSSRRRSCGPAATERRAPGEGDRGERADRCELGKTGGKHWWSVRSEVLAARRASAKREYTAFS